MSTSMFNDKPNNTTHYSALSRYHGQCSLNNSRMIPHSSPVKGRYGVLATVHHSANRLGQLSSVPGLQNCVFTDHRNKKIRIMASGVYSVYGPIYVSQSLSTSLPVHVVNDL